MLKEFIKINNLKAKIVSTAKPILTVSDASVSLNVFPSNIAKTVLFLDSDDYGVLCVFPGNLKLSEEKVSKVLGDKSISLASPKQVLDVTGYEFDSIPAISVFGVKVLFDKKLLDISVIYCSGGTPEKILKISPQEIIENCEDILIVDICK